MRIVAVDVVGQRIPFSSSFPVSYGAHSDTEHVFVRIRTDSGHLGFGEGTALPWFTGDVTEGLVAITERYLVPRIEDSSLAEAHASLDAFTDSFPGAPGATAAVEMALLDLQAKRAQVPLSELLGVRMRNSVAVTHVVPAVATDEAVANVRDAADRGFRSFKLKADGDVDADVERINAVTAVLPDDAVLRVDANTGWGRYPRAKAVVDRLEQPDRLEYLEQPVDAARIDEMRRLWETTGIPVFADESFDGSADLMKHHDAVAGCHLKLAKTGSVRRLVDMARSAQRHGVTVSIVSAFGTSLDAGVNLHLAAVTDNLSAGAELCTGLTASDPAEPALPVAPSVDVPSGPGIGIELPDRLFEDA